MVVAAIMMTGGLERRGIVLVVDRRREENGRGVKTGIGIEIEIEIGKRGDADMMMVRRGIGIETETTIETTIPLLDAKNDITTMMMAIMTTVTIDAGEIGMVMMMHTGKVRMITETGIQIVIEIALGVVMMGIRKEHASEEKTGIRIIIEYIA